MRWRRFPFCFVCLIVVLSVVQVRQMNTVRSLSRLGSRSGIRPPFQIAVEGNIGSGKTRLLANFEKDEKFDVIPEPVERWRNVHGHNTLELMYRDPSRWSLTFQTYVQLTMLQSHVRQCRATAMVKLLERSIYSAKYCFVENLYKSEKMAEVDYAVLTEWFDWIVQNTDCSLDLIVYLRTKPETVFERLSSRCRTEETGLTLAYLRSLHDLYEDWLFNSPFKLPCELEVIEADGDAGNVFDQFVDILDKRRLSTSPAQQAAPYTHAVSVKKRRSA